MGKAGDDDHGRLPRPGSGRGRGRRSADLGLHGTEVARRAVGLEAALVDNERRAIAALDPADARVFDVLVAGPAALLVAKAHKIRERLDELQAGDGRARSRRMHWIVSDYCKSRARRISCVVSGCLTVMSGRGTSPRRHWATCGTFSRRLGPTDRGLLAQSVAGIADEDVVVAAAVALIDELLETYNAHGE